MASKRAVQLALQAVMSRGKIDPAMDEASIAQSDLCGDLGFEWLDILEMEAYVQTQEPIDLGDEVGKQEISTFLEFVDIVDRGLRGLQQAP